MGRAPSGQASVHPGPLRGPRKTRCPISSPHGQGDFKKKNWKTVWQLLKNLNVALAYEAAIPPLGRDREELEAGSSRGLCPPRSEQRFHDSQGGTAARVPSDGWRASQMCNMRTAVYHSSPQKERVVTTWMHLEDIVLSEIILSPEDKYCAIPFL